MAVISERSVVCVKLFKFLVHECPLLGSVCIHIQSSDPLWAVWC